MLGVLLISMGGCGIWPVMTEENGRRPMAMGKNDQVFSPWATQPVHLGEEYGRSYRQAVESQIVNPQAVRSLALVEGIDGMASQSIMARYQSMFQNPPYAKLMTEGGTKK